MDAKLVATSMYARTSSASSLDICLRFLQLSVPRRIVNNANFEYNRCDFKVRTYTHECMDSKLTPSG